MWYLINGRQRCLIVSTTISCNWFQNIYNWNINHKRNWSGCHVTLQFFVWIVLMKRKIILYLDNFCRLGIVLYWQTNTFHCILKINMIRSRKAICSGINETSELWYCYTKIPIIDMNLHISFYYLINSKDT